MAKVITPLNISEILGETSVAVVDFWATWCGPCRILSPTVDELAAELAGDVTVAKCNVDDCEDIASDYGIRSIPTLLFFKDGQVVDRLVGVVPKETILEKINGLK